jgi:hypothetical protein
MISFLQRYVTLLMLLAVPAIGLGQEEADADAPPASTPAPSLKTSVSVAPSGVRRFEPGTWSTLAITAWNRTDADTNELVSVFVGNNSSLQFARRFWLPAGTRRQTFVPILIPKTSSIDPSQSQSASPQIDASIIRVDETDGGETYKGGSSQQHISKTPLALDYSVTKSGLLLHRQLPDGTGYGPAEDWNAYEMAYKAREAAVDSRIMIDFGTDFLPPYPTTLDSLDQMVISGDRILDDSAGLANLRHWLYRGGRVWIMLDQTSMETVTALLGNEARCSVVDRVEMNEFLLEDVTSEEAPHAWSSEVPVEMLRVFAGTDDIHCLVNGWPAAFWQKVGDGEVLFTTLGPRGWVESGNATLPLRSMAVRFFQPRDEVVVDATDMGSMLSDQIGYRIPSRGLAALILGLNSLALLSFGSWWAWRKKLERLAWFVPGAALATSAVFLFVGSRNTVAVPSTVATGQVVRVSYATNESYIAAVTAVYSQESGDLELIAANGTLATINTDNVQGTINRLVWDDDGKSRWANLHQPSGVVRYIESKRTVTHAEPRLARGTFDETGFHGILVGIDVATCEDALIAVAPARACAVSLDSSGSFHVGLRDVLAEDQYISDGLMSDAQRSRQELLRRLLASTASTPFGADPTLLVWTPPLEMGVSFDASFQSVGSALMSLPLRIDRPETGVDVQIPATFIRIDSVSGRFGSSSVFNDRTGKWMERANKPTTTQLRCRIPKALVPLQINEATLTIKINAPTRTLSIEGFVDGELVSLVKRDNPNGVLRFVIDRPEALELDESGGFHLLIRVTETELQRQNSLGQSMLSDQFDNSTWQIDYVSVDAKGTVR